MLHRFGRNCSRYLSTKEATCCSTLLRSKYEVNSKCMHRRRSLHSSSINNNNRTALPVVVKIESDCDDVINSVTQTLAAIGFTSSLNSSSSLTLGNNFTIDIINTKSSNRIKKFINKNLLNSKSIAAISDINIGRVSPGSGDSLTAMLQCPYSGVSRPLNIAVAENLDINNISSSSSSSDTIDSNSSKNNSDRNINNSNNINDNNSGSKVHSNIPPIFLKELIVPCGDSGMSNLLTLERKLTDLQYSPIKGGFGLFSSANGSVDAYGNASSQSSGHISIRLIPSNLPVLVFRTPNSTSLESIKLTLEQRQIRYENIGHTGSTEREGEIRLIFEHTYGIEIRITSDPTIYPFFNEGHAVLMERSIPEIQSVRVAGDNLKENKFGTAGDCWSEMKASSKNVVINKFKNLFN